MSSVNKHNTLKWLLPCLVSIVFYSCGASERMAKSQEETSAQEGKKLPSPTPSSPSDKENPTPSPRVLVSPADMEAKEIKLIEDGRASWYGPKFHGRLTANGEEFDMNGLTAAHRTLPFNTLVLVKNLDSGKSVTVRINDRGPFAKNRIIDLSRKAARQIGMISSGTAHVELFVPKQSVNSSQSTNLTTPTYTVQLGSYDNEAPAFNHSSKVSGSRVEIVRLNDRTVYRVYFGLYVDKDKAYQKQQELERRNFSGFVKQIENG